MHTVSGVCLFFYSYVLKQAGNKRLNLLYYGIVDDNVSIY